MPRWIVRWKGRVCLGQVWESVRELVTEFVVQGFLGIGERNKRLRGSMFRGIG